MNEPDQGPDQGQDQGQDNSEQDNNAELVLLGKSEFAEAKRVQAALAERGIHVSLLNNPESCATGGCKPTVELYARPTDLPAIGEFIDEERNRLFAGLEVNGELLNEVYDPERDTARCPACGTVFSTKATQCPDCGLAFA